MEHRRYSALRISAHNGTGERFNRTTEDKTRVLKLENGFPSNFWDLAIGTAEFIDYRTPHSAIQMSNPFQKWTESVPQFKYISSFGAVTCHLNTNRISGGKFDEVFELYFFGGIYEHGLSPLRSQLSQDIAIL